MSAVLVRLLPPALLLVLVELTYAPGLQNGYVGWDDSTYIRDNPNMLSVAGLGRIWFTFDHPQYYPLTFTSYWLEYRLWGPWPTGYYLVNVVLHAVNSLLVLALARRCGLGTWAGWFVAAVFALHPMQVASVAWLAERKNVLSGSLALGAFLFYWRHRSTNNWNAYIVSLTLFAGALLSKTAVMTLPVSMWLADRLIRGRRDWVGLWRLVPFLLLAAGLGLVTVFVEHDAPIETMPVAVRPAAAGLALWFYCGRLLWPRSLPALYPHWTIDPAIAWWWLPLLAAVGVGWAVWYWRRRLPGASVWGLAHYVISLAPTLGLVPFGYLAFAPVADHFAYLALLGPVLAAFGACQRRSAPGRPVRAVLAARRVWRGGAALVGLVLVIAMAVRSHQQVLVWRDPGSLWSYTLRHNPNSPIAHVNLGLYLEQQGNAHAARFHYAEAARLKPDYAQAHSNLSGVLTQLGEHPAALWHARRAIELQPQFAEAHNNLGSVLGNLGRHEEAAAEFAQAIRLKPSFAKGYANLGAALMQLGRFEEAVAVYQELLRRYPTDPDGHLNLGLALASTGDIPAAVAHYQTALRYRPGWLEAELRLAWTWATWEAAPPADVAQAVRLAEQAWARVQPASPALLDVLAATYAAAGRFADAVRVAEQARELALSRRQTDLLPALDERLTLYRSGRPFRLSNAHRP